MRRGLYPVDGDGERHGEGDRERHGEGGRERHGERHGQTNGEVLIMPDDLSYTVSGIRMHACTLSRMQLLSRNGSSWKNNDQWRRPAVRVQTSQQA